MDNKFSFTDSRILKIRPPSGGRSFYYDTKQPMLRFQVTATGTKTFQVYAWDPMRKRPVTLTLGKYPRSIEQARREASIRLEQIHGGMDISESRRQRRTEWTLRQAFQAWLDTHVSIHRSPKYRFDSEQLFNRHIDPIFGNKLVSDIGRDAVRAWHRKLTEKPRERGAGCLAPSTANRCLALVRSIYSQMMEHLDNPARGVKQFRERSRDRFLKPEELKRFFISIGEEPNQNIPDFLLIALFTGARRANVLAMKWGDIDFSLGTWTIRAEESKNREPMTIPLVAPVVEILLRRKQLARSIFVFPGSGKAGHLVEPKSGWTRIIHRAGLKDVRIHDLRRTLGSFQAIGGASTAIIGKSLGHKNPQSTSIYSRLSLDPVRKSVEAAVELMQTSAEASAQSQVVDIRKGR